MAVFSAGVVVGERGFFNTASTRTTTITDQNGLPEDLNYEQVEEVYDLVRKNYDGDLSEADFMEELKAAIATATGDPYTEFFTSEDAIVFNDELDGTFTGIGAELGKKDGNLIVVAPLAGYPAEAAGLRSQDIIAQINDEDTTGMSVYEAVLKIRGEAGTDVTLTIVRNETDVLEITITRAIIDAPSVKYEIKDGIGTVTISQFSDDTSDLVEEAARAFVQANVKGVILDMRGNPGGYLDQAVKVAGIWLAEDTTVVEVRKGDTVIESYEATGSHRLKDMPTVALINEGSASASEIVAGALKDYGVATLVGTKTYGKGSVQNINELDAGELIKITTARWYTPKGNNIDKDGISPDIEIERSEEDFESGADPQLDRALQILQ